MDSEKLSGFDKQNGTLNEHTFAEGEQNCSRHAYINKRTNIIYTFCVSFFHQPLRLKYFVVFHCTDTLASTVVFRERINTSVTQKKEMDLRASSIQRLPVLDLPNNISDIDNYTLQFSS